MWADSSSGVVIAQPGTGGSTPACFSYCGCSQSLDGAETLMQQIWGLSLPVSLALCVLRLLVTSHI